MQLAIEYVVSRPYIILLNLRAFTSFAKKREGKRESEKEGDMGNGRTGLEFVCLLVA